MSLQRRRLFANWTRSGFIPSVTTIFPGRAIERERIDYRKPEIFKRKRLTLC